jgi:outer membrane protein
MSRKIGAVLVMGWTMMIVAPAGAAGQTAGDVLELSLERALEMALAPEGSRALQIARLSVRQAASRSAEARSALLPNLEGSVSQLRQTRNLRAFGIELRAPVPCFEFPECVGPFGTFDARATLYQNVFDLSSVRRYQASKVGVSEARALTEDAQDQVAGQVAKLYMAALRANARVAAAESAVELATRLEALADSQRRAGTGTGIEVTRASVQLENERQRLLVARNDQRRAELQLLRAMGVDLDVHVRLTGALEYQPVATGTAGDALQSALTTRADYLAQQRKEERFRLLYGGAKWERLPALRGVADYGSIGTSVGNAFPTYRYGVALEIPVFDGGRRDARRASSQAEFEAERVRTRELRDQIELEIRLALDALASAAEQVQVSNQGWELASRELEQAERRYRAGVASSVEVTDAQTRLERARENRIAALFQYNVARVDLMEAKGTIRSEWQVKP